MDSKEIIQNEVGSSEEISELEAMKNNEVEGRAEMKTDTSEFSVKTKKEDFTLIVENSKLFVNRSVLSLASPVFEEMLDSNPSDQRLDEIELKGKKYDDVCEFIRCIHPGKMKKVSGENVDHVFPLACEYKVEHLMKACAEVLKSNLTPTPPAADILDVLVKANQYGLENLKEKSMVILHDKPLEELDRAERQSNKEIPVEVKTLVQALLIEKLRTELEKTRQRLRASVVLSNIVGRFSPDGTQLLASQNSNDTVGWCKAFELSALRTYDCRQSLKAQFSSCDLQVSFDTERKSRELHVLLEIVSSKCIMTTFISTFVVKNWMRGKEDHVVNWTTSMSTPTSKQSRSVGTLDQLEKETNGFMYKEKIQCEIYILQTGTQQILPKKKIQFTECEDCWPSDSKI